MEIISILISVIALGISFASIYYAYSVSTFQRKLFPNNKIKTSLLSDIKNYYEKTQLALSEHESILKDIDLLKKDNLKNLHSIAVRRFNPYEEAGGDLSFILVMLDRKKNGVMLTSLHGRDRTRMYSRIVIHGAIDSELLFDEKEILNEAINKNEY